METDTKTETSTGNAFMDKYLTPMAVVVGALIIGGALVYGHALPQAPTQQPGTPPSVAVDIKNVKTDGDPFIGNANAPVTVAFWFDYQCPFCKQFETTTMPQIVMNYVASGKVKVVFKDFQFLGPDSLADAEFARAVWEAYPDHFYDWYVAMFNTQPEENSLSAADNETRLETTASSIPGIDVAKVLALVKQKKTQYDAAIVADQTEGQSLGINGTPSFIIGTTLLTGAQPYSAVSPLLDAQLKK